MENSWQICSQVILNSIQSSPHVEQSEGERLTMNLYVCKSPRFWSNKLEPVNNKKSGQPRGDHHFFFFLRNDWRRWRRQLEWQYGQQFKKCGKYECQWFSSVDVHGIRRVKGSLADWESSKQSRGLTGQIDEIVLRRVARVTISFENGKSQATFILDWKLQNLQREKFNENYVKQVISVKIQQVCKCATFDRGKK